MARNNALALGSSSPSLVSIALYLVIFAVYAEVQGHFAVTPYEISVLLNNSIALAIGATALTFVIVTGGFDLSLAGTVALTNTILSVAALNGVAGAIEGLIIVCALGAVVGAVNGLLVSLFQAAIHCGDVGHHDHDLRRGLRQ